MRTSLKDIADACGIQAGSLYHHFDSKEAIVVELVARFQAEMASIGDAALKSLVADEAAANSAAANSAVAPGEQVVALCTSIAGCAFAHRAALQLTFYEPPAGACTELVNARPASVLAGMTAILRRAQAAGSIKHDVVLALERYRRGCFVAAIVALFFAVVAGFGYLFYSAGNQRYGELARGLLPHVADGGALTLVVGIVGAGLAGLANAAMLCVAAALPRALGASAGDLTTVYSDLGRVGGGCAAAFGIALIASGFASSAVGTYAGQVVMSGFIGQRIPVVVRRGITMVPSLVVLALAVEPTEVLVLSQVILSFCIPFALVPLILVSRERDVMRDLTNRHVTTAALGLACGSRRGPFR